MSKLISSIVLSIILLLGFTQSALANHSFCFSCGSGGQALQCPSTQELCDDGEDEWCETTAACAPAPTPISANCASVGGICKGSPPGCSSNETFIPSSQCPSIGSFVCCVPNATPTSASCVETDPGNDPKFAGTCTVFGSSGLPDFCLNPEHVTQFRCSANICVASTSLCALGLTCVNGACVLPSPTPTPQLEGCKRVNENCEAIPCCEPQKFFCNNSDRCQALTPIPTVPTAPTPISANCTSAGGVCKGSPPGCSSIETFIPSSQCTGTLICCVPGSTAPTPVCRHVGESCMPGTQLTCCSPNINICNPIGPAGAFTCAPLLPTPTLAPKSPLSPCAEWVYSYPTDSPKFNLNTTPIPTNDKDTDLKNRKCAAVQTAIGTVSIEPKQFVARIFGLVLGLSAGISLILIIISGYKFMTTGGNPESFIAARDMLVSAIAGLLFIIFAFVILQIIGVDILRIPGFG